MSRAIAVCAMAKEDNSTNALTAKIHSPTLKLKVVKSCRASVVTNASSATVVRRNATACSTTKKASLMTRGNPIAVSAELPPIQKVWAEWNTEKTCVGGIAEGATNTTQDPNRRNTSQHLSLLSARKRRLINKLYSSSFKSGSSNIYAHFSDNMACG